MELPIVTRSKGLRKVVTGGLSLSTCVWALSAFGRFLPSLHLLKDYLDGLHFYWSYLSKHVGSMLPEILRESIFGISIADIIMVWLLLFAALNLFIYRTEGQLVWGHIRQKKCCFESQGNASQLLCTAPKYLVSFIAAPWVAICSVIKTFATGNSYLEMANLTVHSAALAKYFFAVIAIPVLLALGASLLLVKL
jgi:hypothetical protein